MSNNLTDSAPTGLLCELMENPDITYLHKNRLKFGWIVGNSAKNKMQTAYQILVASSMEVLKQDQGDMWDSGKTETGESINIIYDGTPLESNSVYYWKVRTWNESEKPTPYSEPQKFCTGKIIEDYVTERYPLIKNDLKPLEVIQKDTGHYFIDFGKDAFGTISFKLIYNTSIIFIDLELEKAK